MGKNNMQTGFTVNTAKLWSSIVATAHWLELKLDALVAVLFWCCVPLLSFLFFGLKFSLADSAIAHYPAHNFFRTMGHFFHLKTRQLLTSATSGTWWPAQSYRENRNILLELIVRKSLINSRWSIIIISLFKALTL